MLTQYGVSEKKMALYFLCGSCYRVLHHTQFVIKSLLWIPVIYMELFLLLHQYCSFSFSQVTDFFCQFRLYWHHMIGLLSNHKILLSIIISSCSNSKSWSWHQICDTSFSCITSLVVLVVKFSVFGYL